MSERNDGDEAHPQQGGGSGRAQSDPRQEGGEFGDDQRAHQDRGQSEAGSQSGPD